MTDYWNSSILSWINPVHFARSYLVGIYQAINRRLLITNSISLIVWVIFLSSVKASSAFFFFLVGYQTRYIQVCIHVLTLAGSWQPVPVFMLTDCINAASTFVVGVGFALWYRPGTTLGGHRRCRREQRRRSFSRNVGDQCVVRQFVVRGVLVLSHLFILREMRRQVLSFMVSILFFSIQC